MNRTLITDKRPIGYLKLDLIRRYGLLVYSRWSRVPKHYFTKTALKHYENLELPQNVYPVAIKNDGLGKRAFFLYDINEVKKAMQP